MPGRARRFSSHVEDYRARGPRQPRAALYAETVEARDRHSLLNLRRAPLGLEAEVVQKGDRARVEHAPENRLPRRELRIRRPFARGVLGQQNLLGVERRKHRQEILWGVELRAIEFAGAHLHPRGVEPAGAVYVDGENVVAAAAVELGVLHHRPGRDYPRDRPFYELSRDGGLVLVADGDLFVARQNLREILVYDVVRYARHGVVLPLGERNPEQARTLDGVVVKHFVKIPEPEKQEGVFRQRIFHAPILFEHGGGLFRFLFRFRH